MIRTTRFLPLFFAFTLFFCGKDTQISECHPQEGRFIGGQHYIASEMLTEDGNWNYQSMHRYFDKKGRFYSNKECLPLNPPVTLREKLSEVSETIDMER